MSTLFALVSCRLVRSCPVFQSFVLSCVKSRSWLCQLALNALLRLQVQLDSKFANLEIFETLLLLLLLLLHCIAFCFGCYSSSSELVSHIDIYTRTDSSALWHLLSAHIGSKVLTKFCVFILCFTELSNPSQKKTTTPPQTMTFLVLRTVTRWRHRFQTVFRLRQTDPRFTDALRARSERSMLMGSTFDGDTVLPFDAQWMIMLRASFV